MNMKHIGLVSCVGVLLLCAFIGIASVTISSAEVTELNVPPVVVQGETLSISGTASPNEEVWLKSSFAISLPVSNERYSRDFTDVDFPKGEKVFSVTAENIKNIRVSLSPVFWQTVTITCSGQTMTITFPGGTITRPLEESIDERGVVSFSISFPVSIGSLPALDITGKKDIKISGDAADNATSVNLKVATSIKVIADSNGDFTLDINTGGVPLGEFLISAGGIEKRVEVVSEEQTPTPTPSPSPTPTPSSNGGDGDGAPDTTPTPTPSPSPSPTPTPSPSPSPSPTLSPSPSTSPSPTPALTTMPTPSAPAPTPSPTPSPSSSKRRIPGFEAIFAIAGLLAVAYLVLRKRE